MESDNCVFSLNPSAVCGFNRALETVIAGSMRRSTGGTNGETTCPTTRWRVRHGRHVTNRWAIPPKFQGVLVTADRPSTGTAFREIPPAFQNPFITAENCARIY